MQKLINKYPIDLTGKNPNNFIVGEPHDLNVSVSGPNRVFVPLYGGFYTADIKLYDATGQILTPNVDYVASYLYEEASLRSGLEVCGAVVVTNPNVANTVYMDYQVVGGDYAVSTHALEQVIEALDEDERPVQWGNITGKPDTYPAAGHRHALWELYGFEYVVIELERVAQAIVAGYQPSLDEVRAYALSLFNEGLDHTNWVDGKLDDHVADKSNPHAVTKAQAGLGVVENYPPSSKPEAIAGVRSDRYMTPDVTREAIASQAGNLLQQHVDDQTNPHNVTKAQAGLGVVENYPPANKTEAELGVRHDRYMTPRTTKEAIDIQAGNLLQQHVDDDTNPHQVTKAQVGLGKVENHQLSSELEARAGTLNTRYMTPLRVAQAIETLAGELLDQHIADKNNPHDVTKAQVGLSQVENYPVATPQQATDMVATDAYVVPANLRSSLDRHIQLGEHDDRYVRKGVNDNTSLRVYSGQLQGMVNGTWRTIWPAQWA